MNQVTREGIEPMIPAPAGISWAANSIFFSGYGIISIARIKYSTPQKAFLRQLESCFNVEIKRIKMLRERIELPIRVSSRSACETGALKEMRKINPSSPIPPEKQTAKLMNILLYRAESIWVTASLYRCTTIVYKSWLLLVVYIMRVILTPSGSMRAGT